MGHACTFYMARRDHDYISWWPHVLLLAEKFLCVTSLSATLFRILFLEGIVELVAWRGFALVINLVPLVYSIFCLVVVFLSLEGNRISCFLSFR